MATITLSPELSERIEKAAAARGQDTNAYAAALMAASLDADLRDFEDACAGIARGLAQARAGQTIDGDAYLAERKAAREARRQAREAAK